MGGQFIPGIDLYMGKYGNLVLSLQEDVKFPTRITEKAKNVLSALLQKSPSTRWEKKNEWKKDKCILKSIKTDWLIINSSDGFEMLCRASSLTKNAFAVLYS